MGPMKTSLNLFCLLPLTPCSVTFSLLSLKTVRIRAKRMIQKRHQWLLNVQWQYWHRYTYQMMWTFQWTYGSSLSRDFEEPWLDLALCFHVSYVASYAASAVSVSLGSSIASSHRSARSVKSVDLFGWCDRHKCCQHFSQEKKRPGKSTASSHLDAEFHIHILSDWFYVLSNVINNLDPLSVSHWYGACVRVVWIIAVAL